MNAATQSKVSYSESLKSRKMHLNGLINLVQSKTGKTTKIETLTIAAISAEMIVIELRLKIGLILRQKPSRSQPCPSYKFLPITITA